MANSKKLELAKVGFKWRWLVRTHARKCPLGICDSWDAYLWAKQAAKWITAARKRAKTPEQKRIVNRQIIGYHKVVKRASGCVLTCQSSVDAFVAICRLSKLATEAWGRPVFIDEVPYVWPGDDPKGIKLNADDSEWLSENPKFVGLMVAIWSTAKKQVKKMGDDAEKAAWGRVLPWVAGGFAVFVVGTFVVAQAKAPRKFARMK